VIIEERESWGWEGMCVRIVTAFIAMCTAQAALAQAPAPRFYDWTGMYVGAHGGYASGSITETASGATTSSAETISGAILGGQIGANFQYQSILFGVEVDGDWSNQRASGTTLAVNMPWLATARVRVGYAYDNIAYYATGGAGYIPFTSAVPARTAWVAGIGQESAINRNLLLRFEVLYLQLLPKSEIPVSVTPGASVQKLYDVTARVGLSYKFGWPGQ